MTTQLIIHFVSFSGRIRGKNVLHKKRRLSNFRKTQNYQSKGPVNRDRRKKFPNRNVFEAKTKSAFRDTFKTKKENTFQNTFKINKNLTPPDTFIPSRPPNNNRKRPISKINEVIHLQTKERPHEKEKKKSAFRMAFEQDNLKNYHPLGIDPFPPVYTAQLEQRSKSRPSLFKEPFVAKKKLVEADKLKYSNQFIQDLYDYDGNYNYYDDYDHYRDYSQQQYSKTYKDTGSFKTYPAVTSSKYPSVKSSEYPTVTSSPYNNEPDDHFVPMARYPDNLYRESDSNLGYSGIYFPTEQSVNPELSYKGSKRKRLIRKKVKKRKNKRNRNELIFLEDLPNYEDSEQDDNIKIEEENDSQRHLAAGKRDKKYYHDFSQQNAQTTIRNEFGIEPFDSRFV